MRSPRTAVLCRMLVVGFALGSVAIGWAETMKFGWKVLLPDGTPAVGAKVFVRVAKVHHQEMSDSLVVTDADGVFAAEVDLDPQPTAAGRQDYAFVVIDMPEHALVAAPAPTGESPGITETVLSPAFEITGRLTGSDGEPVADGEVSVMRVRPSDEDWKTASRPLNLSTWRATYPPLVARTDGDGRFRLRGVVTAEGPATAAIRASVDGRYSASPRSPNPTVEIIVGLDTPPLKLSVRTPISVSGMVLHSATGAPVAGASVRPIAYPYRSVSSIQPAVTDGEGRFTITSIQPVENLYVEATHAELARAWQKLPVTRSSEGVELKLRPWARLTGRLVDQDTGQPLAVEGVWISVVWDAGQLSGGNAHDARVEPGIEKTQTDAEGRFTVKTAVGKTKITAGNREYREVAPVFVDVPAEGAEASVPMRERNP